MSDKSLKKFFKTEPFDGKNLYSCNNCEYQTTIKLDMNYHIRKHMKTKYKFQCNQTNCDEVFKTELLLKEHETNHLCGFGIKDMEDIGFCGQKQIKEYYEITVIDNEFRYRCLSDGCDKDVKYVDAMERHVHKEHRHPLFKKTKSSRSGQNSRNS